MSKLDLQLSRTAGCICNICLAVITEKAAGAVEPGETGVQPVRRGGGEVEREIQMLGVCNRSVSSRTSLAQEMQLPNRSDN